MNLIFTFAELDKLYEATNSREYAWSFDGKVRFYNKSLGREDTIVIKPTDGLKTKATSEKQALNNIKHQIRLKFNLPSYTPLEFFDYDITNVTELLSQQPTEDIPTCSCGVKLNHSRECPVCDLGELDYLD
jgi:hypothetical protein